MDFVERLLFLPYVGYREHLACRGFTFIFLCTWIYQKEDQNWLRVDFGPQAFLSTILKEQKFRVQQQTVSIQIDQQFQLHMW